MSETFRVILLVTTASKLATIMQVLDGEAKLTSVEQLEEKAPKKRRSYVRHAANGTRGIDIALDLAKGGGEITTKAVEKAFEAKGLASNSAAPRLSDLVKMSKLTLIRSGVYKITPNKGV